MRDIILITFNSIKNNLKSRITIVIFICITLMITAGLAAFICILLIVPEINKPSPDRTLLESYLGLIMYAICFVFLGINMNVYAFQSMTKEKSRGNLESLMATPLSVKNIWIAKSLAVFIPGMVLGEILTLVALLAVNYIYFVPGVGFIYSHWIGLSSFLAVPLIYLFISLLAHLIGLTGRPATGNVIVQVFLPVVLTLMINLTVRNILDATSWPFISANLGLAAIIAVIIISLQPRITRERIILSG